MEQTSKKTIVSLKDIFIKFDGEVILNHINLDINEKEFVTILGPSGCGKSTLLKSLNRMNDLVPGVRITGEVKYDGKDIFSPGTDVNELRKNIGMVFQKPNPFPMSVYDNIAYGPRTHGIRSKAKLDDIVERSLRNAAIWDELKDRLKKSALGLSGGQQQRLCIARALAVEPEVLLMDEPFASLDFITRGELQAELLDIQKELQKTILLVTHQLDEALLLAQRIVVLHADSSVRVWELELPYPRDLTSPQLAALREEVTAECRKD